MFDLTFNNPTHYLLDYDDFHLCADFMSIELGFMYNGVKYCEPLFLVIDLRFLSHTISILMPWNILDSLHCHFYESLHRYFESATFSFSVGQNNLIKSSTESDFPSWLGKLCGSLFVVIKLHFLGHVISVIIPWNILKSAHC